MTQLAEIDTISDHEETATMGNDTNRDVDTENDTEDLTIPEYVSDVPEYERVRRALDEEAGVDHEGDDTEFGQRILDPFDPTLIRVETRSMIVDSLLKRMRDQAINLQPDFQRMGGIWSDINKSRLIESLLVRIPLPAFYIDASDDDMWLVIDGLQRLTALKRFVIDQSLRLTGLEFLSEFNGKTFGELPRNLQRRIEEAQITAYLVQRGTPPKVKFNIFSRINTGGVPLSAQEIRHALNLGKSTDLLKRMAASEPFRRATNGSVSQMRMADRECALRFLAFCIVPYIQYKSSDELDSFLSERMVDLNGMSNDQLAQYEARFERAMNIAYQLFEKNAFRKVSITGRRSTVSKALFESWSVNLDALTDEQVVVLTRRRQALMNKFSSLLRDVSFDKSISQATGDAGRVRTRFSSIERIINEILER